MAGYGQNRESAPIKEVKEFSDAVKYSNRPSPELRRLKPELTALVFAPEQIDSEWYDDDSRWTARMATELRHAGFQLSEGVSPRLCMVGLRCLKWCTVGEAKSLPLAFARALSEFASHPLRRVLLPRSEVPIGSS